MYKHKNCIPYFTVDILVMIQESLSNVLLLEGSDDGQPLQSSGNVRVDRTASCACTVCVYVCVWVQGDKVMLTSNHS